MRWPVEIVLQPFRQSSSEREQTMKYFITQDLALSRPPEGPAASYIIPFAEWLVDRGYGLVSTRNQVRMAAGFSKWLRQKGVELPCWSILGGTSPSRQAWRGMDHLAADRISQRHRLHSNAGADGRLDRRRRAGQRVRRISAFGTRPLAGNIGQLSTDRPRFPG